MPMLGEIKLFAGSYDPVGWAACDGRLLPISSNTALFSVLGTSYGGDGRTTFALPDLRGRVAVHDAMVGTLGGVATLPSQPVAAGTGATVAAGGASNLQPYCALRFVIATTGTYPART